MKICITGSRGRLGSELVRRQCIPLVSDITNPETLHTEINIHQPDLIINCAALTSVDEAEDPDKAYKFIEVNGYGVDILRTCFDGRIIQISTDYVFAGDRGPYAENITLDYRQSEAVNEYGFSKVVGEAAILDEYRSGDTVVRTTGLYGNSDHEDFVKAVLRRLENNLEFHATHSLKGNQTYIPHLAEGLIWLATMIEEPPPVLHIASEEVISRYEFALMIANTFGYDPEMIKPTNNNAPGWVAKRPTKGGLKVNKAKKLGVPIYKIHEGLQELRG